MALSTTTQHAVPYEFDKKWGTELTSLPSAYPPMSRRREAKKNKTQYLNNQN